MPPLFLFLFFFINHNAVQDLSINRFGSGRIRVDFYPFSGVIILGLKSKRIVFLSDVIILSFNELSVITR